MASAGLGILLISLTGGVILAGDGLSGLALGWVGIPSTVIILLYAAGMWGIFRHERGRQQSPKSATETEGPVAPAQPLYSGESLRAAWIKFTLAAAAVIGAGIWLAFIGEDIVGATGWGASFVGSLLLAISTSLPEMVIGIAALRLGAIDMAVANVLGANMINVAKIFIIDIFYTEGAVLSSVSQAHVTTAAVAVAMTLVVLIGLRFRPRRKTFGFVSWYSVVLVGLYIYGAYALFDSGLGGG
jgi:cation:H+ antiporter